MVSTTRSDDLKRYLPVLKANPAKMQRYMLSMLERLNDGDLMIMDATNPAVFCLESSVVTACAVMTDSESKLRRQYTSMANTPEDLYLHMADVDYLGIFSNPARANVTFLFDLDEIRQKAVRENAVSTTKLLTIPRYTKVIVADTPLTLLYPINIRVMPHGGFNITFDTTERTPIAYLENNLLDWFIDKKDSVSYLHIVVPMYQLNVVRHTASINTTSGFSRNYSFTDKYFYTRAYIQESNGTWKEIKTTMTDLVYNKDEPTLLLKLLNNSINVQVPQIYTNNGKIKDTIRIDIYTTKGEMNVNLSNYSVTNFQHDYTPLEIEFTSPFTAPLKTLSTSVVYSTDSISGGDNGITFSELKDRVTSRSVVTENLPINEKQLTRTIKDLGFSIVKNIDNVTDRQYLASKPLPVPSNKFIVTNMATNISMLEVSTIKLKEHDTVNWSTYRMTIKPDTLYELNSGVLKLLDNSYANTLKTKAINDPTYLANELNNKSILFSPYYYVLDLKGNEFSARIYDLDNPVIRSRYFFQENSTVDINLGIKDYAIDVSPNKDGYILGIELIVGSEVIAMGPDHVTVQLSYKGRDDSNTRYYIQGKLVSRINPQTNKPVDDRYYYEFLIETKYDIDKRDGIIPVPYKSAINLVHEFDIVTIIRDYNPNHDIVNSDIDTIINLEEIDNYQPNSKYFGVTQSKVNIEFGKRLDKLWTKTKTVVDPRQIEVFDHDVPQRYTENIYKTDSTGTIALDYNPETGEASTTLLHNEGDIMYDNSGEVILKHKKGDPKVDEFGDPVYANMGDGLNRQIDLFLIDAAYYFANTLNVLEYKTHCLNLVREWVTNDMNLISNQLLDRSEIFYYPPISIGSIKAVADNKKEVIIDSKQSLKVIAYLNQLNYQNSAIRESLSKTIAQTVQIAISRKRVSLDSILQTLRATIGDTVISFDVKGFLDDQYKTITLVDETQTLSIGKKVVVLPNMSIDIKDDIEIEFLVHDDN